MVGKLRPLPAETAVLIAAVVVVPFRSSPGLVFVIAAAVLVSGLPAVVAVAVEVVPAEAAAAVVAAAALLGWSLLDVPYLPLAVVHHLGAVALAPLCNFSSRQQKAKHTSGGTRRDGRYVELYIHAFTYLYVVLVYNHGGKRTK